MEDKLKNINGKYNVEEEIQRKRAFQKWNKSN